MKFGIDPRIKVSGAKLAVGVQQICAMFPVLYLFSVSSFPVTLTRRGLLSFLFDLGYSSLPRVEALGLSLLYRTSRRETLVNFVLLLLALVLGLAAASLLQGSRKKVRAVRWGMIGFIAVDLLLRLLPLHMNRAFGLPAAILGFAVQTACLLLTALDLWADRKP